jgi:F-type H+-transporting ATPase subunit b
MEIVSNIALISINETLIVQLLSFLIFLFLINRLMFRPLEGVMAERAEYINTLQDEISGAESELNKVSRLLAKQEAATREQAHALRQDMEEAGGNRAGEIFAAVRKEVAELKSQAEEEVEAQLSEARKYLRKESEELSVRIIEKILDRRVGK